MMRFTDPSPPKDDGPFHVGDRVRMAFGPDEVEATVIEDRGNLGFGGKRLYGVVFNPDDVSPEIYVTREADRLTLVARAPAPPRKAKRKKTPRKS